MHVITYSTILHLHISLLVVFQKTRHNGRSHCLYLYVVCLPLPDGTFFFSIHKAHTFARPDIFRKVWSRGSVLAFSTQVRKFKPGRSHRIFKGRKNPQHAFLRRGSKAVGPMS